MSRTCEMPGAPPGCAKLVDCGAGAICSIVEVCHEQGQGGGPCLDCPQTNCLPSPPYCAVDAECPVGPCVNEVCSCDTSADCGGNPQYICKAGICGTARCKTRADCCNRDGVCLACSVDGVCTLPIEGGQDPSLTCGMRGGAPATAGTLAGIAVAGALAVAVARRRRRRQDQKEAATESWGTQSRNGP